MEEKETNTISPPRRHPTRVSVSVSVSVSLPDPGGRGALGRVGVLGRKKEIQINVKQDGAICWAPTLPTQDAPNVEATFDHLTHYARKIHSNSLLYTEPAPSLNVLRT